MSVDSSILEDSLFHITYTNAVIDVSYMIL
jgi:hypothetical protein